MKPRLITIIAIAILGIADSIYLLTVHWGWWQAVCLGVGDCESVNLSRYSELLGIPVAMLGALAYLAIIVTTVFVSRNLYVEYARIALFFIAAVGVVFSAYLTYVELFVLHAVCPWCVLSAILIAALAVLCAFELRTA